MSKYEGEEAEDDASLPEFNLKRIKEILHCIQQKECRGKASAHPVIGPPSAAAPTRLQPDG